MCQSGDNFNVHPENSALAWATLFVMTIMYLIIIGLLHVGFDNCLKSKLTIILYYSRVPDSPTQRGRKSGESCTGMFSIQQWWHSVYRVNPCYKTNAWQQNSTALHVVCMCSVDLYANCGPQKHDSSKYGHAVKLHSIALIHQTLSPSLGRRVWHMKLKFIVMYAALLE